MKKNLLGLLLFSCMGLLVSCSDDDNNNTSGLDAGQIHVSATLPESLAAGQPAITGHKLRCILELWTKGEGAKLAYRSETAVEPAVDGANKVSIDLAADAGTYDCLMWADYIDADATTDGDSRYADKYYDTSDLKNITVKDMNSLIDNDACDAFFYSGEVQKRAGEAFVLETELVRPFTKVSILEKNLREFNLLQSLVASYSAPAAFNVSTGETLGNPETVTHSVAAFNPAAAPDGTLFSAYVFADKVVAYMDEIHLTFTNKHGTQNVTVPSDLVPLSRNRHVKVSGNMMSESPEDDTQFDIVFDIDVADWETGNTEIASVPIKAKVGDFFYADGTYSSTFTNKATNPCIGVVFAVAHDDGKAATDKAENYVDKDGTQKLQEVHGWVIALKDVTGGRNKLAPMPGKATVLDLTQEPASLLTDNCDEGKKDWADILGFKSTEIFKSVSDLSAYPIAEAISNYGNETKAPAGTSGWYWGAVKQYLTLAEEYAKVTVENKVVTGMSLLTVGKSMKTLIDAGLAEDFSLDGEQFYWSNSIEKTKSGSEGMLYRIGLSTKGYNYGQTAAWRVNDTRHVRAILTF